MSTSEEDLSLSRWLAIGSPSIAALGVLCITILSIGFRVRWNKALLPAVILMAIQTTFYVGLYSARKRHSGARDLRFSTGVFGVCSLATGLIGMRYAENLGIASPGTFDSNYRMFSVFIVLGTLLAVGIADSLRRISR